MTVRVYGVRCTCPGGGFDGCKGPMGYRLEECGDGAARWWMIERDGVTLQRDRYDSRAEAEQSA
jgi:hypothetical protein